MRLNHLGLLSVTCFLTTFSIAPQVDSYSNVLVKSLCELNQMVCKQALPKGDGRAVAAVILKDDSQQSREFYNTSNLPPNFSSLDLRNKAIIANSINMSGEWKFDDGSKEMFGPKIVNLSQQGDQITATLVSGNWGELSNSKRQLTGKISENQIFLHWPIARLPDSRNGYYGVISPDGQTIEGNFQSLDYQSGMMKPDDQFKMSKIDGRQGLQSIPDNKSTPLLPDTSTSIIPPFPKEVGPELIRPEFDNRLPREDNLPLMPKTAPTPVNELPVQNQLPRNIPQPKPLIGKDEDKCISNSDFIIMEIATLNIDCRKYGLPDRRQEGEDLHRRLQNLAR